MFLVLVLKIEKSQNIMTVIQIVIQFILNETMFQFLKKGPRKPFLTSKILQFVILTRKLTFLKHLETCDFQTSTSYPSKLYRSHLTHLTYLKIKRKALLNHQKKQPKRFNTTSLFRFHLFLTQFTLQSFVLFLKNFSLN